VQEDLVALLVASHRRRRRLQLRCVGNVKLMRQALDCCHRGWGVVR
jgi:S-(hydroxymethyl)glutathione dehydrogenase/alcohol dehydrogenase